MKRIILLFLAFMPCIHAMEKIETRPDASAKTFATLAIRLKRNVMAAKKKFLQTESQCPLRPHACIRRGPSPLKPEVS